MSHSEHEEPILRTSPARLGKMLAILLGIMIIGGAIFFLNYGYWNSYLPTAGKIQESLGKSAAPGQGQVTGKTINVNLAFVESSDFKVYAFNTVSLSDPNHNPTINANVGDKLV